MPALPMTLVTPTAGQTTVVENDTIANNQGASTISQPYLPSNQSNLIPFSSRRIPPLPMTKVTPLTEHPKDAIVDNQEASMSSQSNLIAFSSRRPPLPMTKITPLTEHPNVIAKDATANNQEAFMSSQSYRASNQPQPNSTQSLSKKSGVQPTLSLPTLTYLEFQ
jgi:muconolactone delta-isomerase